MMVAFANAAAVMISYAPARVVRTRAKLYDPREMSLAVGQHVRQAHDL